MDAEEACDAEEVVPVAQLELAEVELTAEPVVCFFQIRVSNADGFAWTVSKPHANLIRFFNDMSPLTGLENLPWNVDEVSLVNNDEYHSVIQERLDALLTAPAVMGERRFLDFFQVGEEYQPTVRRVSSSKEWRGGVAGAAPVEGPACRGSARRMAQRAEQLVGEVFQELERRSAEEREAWEQLCGKTTETATLRRQKAYSDKEKSLRMQAASIRHLKRHPDWLVGRNRLSDAEMRDRITMQHFVDLDIKDFQPPEIERCYAFGADRRLVSRQLVLDATRSTYEVDGRKFHWPRLFEEHERPDNEESILRKVFVDALLASIQDSLERSVSPPSLLPRVVTLAMSQAGLANLDLACGPPHLAVGGGESKAQFKLEARADGAWDVTLLSQKTGFDSFTVCSMKVDGDATPSAARSCSPRSTILKTCKVRFSVPIGEYTVEADVLSLHNELTVVSRWGRPLLGKASCAAWCRAGLCALGDIVLQLCSRKR